MDEPTTIIVCPPPCSNGKRCREEVTCAPETCEYGQKGWKHNAEHIKHHCAHDFDSGPQHEWTYPEGGGVVTRSCACGMTAFSHDMRYGP